MISWSWEIVSHDRWGFVQLIHRQPSHLPTSQALASGVIDLDCWRLGSPVPTIYLSYLLSSSTLWLLSAHGRNLVLHTHDYRGLVCGFIGILRWYLDTLFGFLLTTPVCIPLKRRRGCGCTRPASSANSIGPNTFRSWPCHFQPLQMQSTLSLPVILQVP